ncbi:MAG: hypothetical protein K2J08_03465 [Ruminococcus sp.]|nr:hypothetical protein [Ruminococcus sp.]
MYLLSYLIENYIYNRKHFNKRVNYLYLSGWVENMLDSGYKSPSLENFSRECYPENSVVMFEKIINELNLLHYAGFSEINEDFLYYVSAKEYIKGCYESATEFLYYKEYMAEMLGFPHKIEYSAVTDCYYAGGMLSHELENFSIDFLEKNMLIN